MYYKRFIGDYRKKTARLTPLEHGVYGLLLDEFYATEAPLPLDAGELANIVGARTNADNAAVQKVLGRYFTETDAGLGERPGFGGGGQRQEIQRRSKGPHREAVERERLR